MHPMTPFKRSRDSEERTLPEADFYLPIISNEKTPYISAIASGQKTAEGRINGSFVRRLKIGHSICLHNRRQFVLCRIVYLTTYKTFEEMIKGEGLNKLIPWAKSEDEAVKIYKSFPGANRITTCGAVAIGLEPLSSGG